MSNTSDVIRGAIKLDSFIQGRCFTSWEDFIKQLPTLLAIELPPDITNITIGNQQPTDDQRDNLWIRKDNSGSFLGFYLYAQGAWQQIFPVPNEIFLIYGDSRAVPAGYQLASNSSQLTVNQVTVLKKLWHLGGTSPDWYDMFHVTYIGF